MEYKVSDEEVAFRDEIRDFIKNNLKSTVKSKILSGAKLSKSEYVDWQGKLYEKGWIAPSWPVEYGGCGWGVGKRRIFHQEMALACAPEVIPFGITMVGPVIYTFGNEDQKRKFLPDILRSKTWWCQGFSEPNAGSDLASLSTKAVDHGDYYLVSGQKTWTTHGMYADMMFCLARTSESSKKQEGISFLLIDMSSKGVERRPIKTIDEGESICEVFFDNVRVPKENLVGDEGKGWSYAKFLLGHERAMIARVGRSKMLLRRAKEIIGQQSKDSLLLSQNSVNKVKCTQIEARLRALEISELRALELSEKGSGIDPRVASMLKIEGSEICQELTELLVSLNGLYGVAFEGRYSRLAVGGDSAEGVMGDLLFSRVASIYGGSNEIQKNIIAKASL